MIRATMLTLALAAGVLTAGCYEEHGKMCARDCGHECPPAVVDKNAPDAFLVNLPNDIAIRSAVIRQQTLYPYDFVTDAAPLNDLGRSDVAILASYYRDYPGRLSIRRGDASPQLYDARVKEVLATLQKAGVKMDRASISDMPARGEGIPSEKVLIIEAIEAKPVAAPPPSMMTGEIPMGASR